MEYITFVKDYGLAGLILLGVFLLAKIFLKMEEARYNMLLNKYSESLCKMIKLTSEMKEFMGYIKGKVENNEKFILNIEKRILNIEQFITREKRKKDRDNNNKE